MRLVALLAVLAACDFYLDDEQDQSAADAGPSDGDDGERCTAWQLERAAATSLAMMDEEPYEVGRTARVAVSTVLAACEERAMPAVEIDADGLTVAVQLPVWRQVEGDCGDGEMEISRPVGFRFPAAGTWTVSADGAEPISVKVEAEPGGQCGTGNQCRRDCDCSGTAVCLRGIGLGGPFSACVTPCELDRDCGGRGVCVDVADGFARACIDGDECDQSGPPSCPEGFSCEVDSDSCTPDFSLGQEARAPCSCDGDCAEALRCVRTRPDEEARCQITCPTGGPWCQGAHACGRAEDDLSGLATTDSVCIWLGE